MDSKTRIILLIVLAVVLVVGVAVAVWAISSMGRGPEEPAEEPEENPTENEPKPTEEATDPNAMAKAVTGEQVSFVYTVEELLNAIHESGNTVITLQQDVSCNKTIELPYSCTLDLAGHTVATNPQQGLGIQILAAGAENGITTLKNGRLSSYSDSLRVKGGGIVLQDMQVDTAYGTSVALYDPDAAYQSSNRIENSVLSSGGACIGFSQTGTDFSATGITLENTTCISHKAEGAKLFTVGGTVSLPGSVTLGDNVQLYSYADAACSNGQPFLGKTAVKETGRTATAGDQTWQNMNLWTTESDKEVLNILMIGNSFCYSYVDELYGMAESLGYQLNITNLYRGGCSIKSHWTWLDNPIDGAGKCEYFVTGALGRYKHPTITTAAEALEFADWDVITCQQHFDVSRTVDYAAGWESVSPYAANMFSYLKKNYPNAKLYWQQTWSYAVGYQYPDNKGFEYDSVRPNSDVPNVAVQTRQYEVIRDVSAAVCKESGVDLIPTGDAWQLARAQLGDTLNKPDFCHDGDGQGGQYLNACVWLEVLLGESCIGNTWRPGDYILFENKIATLQQAAHEAVAALQQ